MADPAETVVHKKRLGDVLVENGLIDPQDLSKALEQQRKKGKKLGEVLVDLELVTEIQLVHLLADQLGYRSVELETVSIDPAAILLIPERLARKHRVIPIEFQGRSLVVAMADPLDFECIRDLSFFSGYGIQPVLATHREIMESIDHVYKLYSQDHSVDTIVRESEKEFNDPMIQVIPEIKTDGEEFERLEERTRLAPIIRLANIIVSKAIKQKASDIHIEPGPKECRIRYRIDGLLREEMRLPRWVQGVLVSRIKILSSLDIAERRQPQDGAVRIRVENRDIDLRVSVLPVQHGEKIVIRILEQSKFLTRIEDLGLTRPQVAFFDTLTHRKKGIILVTGPTGGGKTTTLYAIINRLKSDTTNVVTVEDPVEYRIDGISQMQVNPEINLTFSKALRALLRQDPNVILIGEIRDKETAEIAFRAAMTGHLVLSTVHTNDATSSITRLIDIGVPHYLVASQLVGVINQRLLRCLCTRCRRAIPTPVEDLGFFKIPLQAVKGVTFYEARGCRVCHQTGYIGRTGIFETLDLTAFLREMIIAGVPEQQLRTTALASGMVGLQEAGLRKVKEGITSLSELARVIEVDEQLESFCQKCGKSVTIDFMICPYCEEPVTFRCSSCAKPLQKDWAVCPYCRHKNKYTS